jgi:two-component system sensor histidine kinase KdpD
MTITKYLNIDEQAVVQWVLKNQKEAGRGTSVFPEAQAFYLPVKGQSELLGIIGIEGILETGATDIFGKCRCADCDGSGQGAAYGRSRTFQSRDRKRNNKKQFNPVYIHDLRTPLTGIAGASSNLIGELQLT